VLPKAFFLASPKSFGQRSPTTANLARFLPIFLRFLPAVDACQLISFAAKKECSHLLERAFYLACVSGFVVIFVNNVALRLRPPLECG